MDTHTAPDAAAAQHVIQAMHLRAQKLPYQEIANRCGYASAGACFNAVHRELKRAVVEGVVELRREESDMLDRLQSALWELAFDTENPNRLQAVDRLLVISKRRSDLMGFDVATKAGPTAVELVIREIPQGYIDVPVIAATVTVPSNGNGHSAEQELSTNE